MSAWYPLWLDPWPFSLKYSNSATKGCVAPVEVQPNRNSVSQGQQVSLRVEERHFWLKKNLSSNLQVETINTGTGTWEPGTQEPNVAPVDIICKKLKFLWGKWEAFPQTPLAQHSLVMMWAPQFKNLLILYCAITFFFPHLECILGLLLIMCTNYSNYTKNH